MWPGVFVDLIRSFKWKRNWLVYRFDLGRNNLIFMVCVFVCVSKMNMIHTFHYHEMWCSFLWVSVFFPFRKKFHFYQNCESEFIYSQIFANTCVGKIYSIWKKMKFLNLMPVCVCVCAILYDAWGHHNEKIFCFVEIRKKN